MAALVLSLTDVGAGVAVIRQGISFGTGAAASGLDVADHQYGAALLDGVGAIDGGVELVSMATGFGTAAGIDASNHNYLAAGLDAVGALGGVLGLGFKGFAVAGKIAESTGIFGDTMAGASTHFLGAAGTVESWFS